MANFSGITFKSPWQTAGGRRSTNLRKMKVNQETGLAWRFNLAAPSSYQQNAPIDLIHKERVGADYPLLLRLIYNKINLNSINFELGNVVGSQQLDLKIWNAYFVPVTLLSIEYDGDSGVTISGQPNPPLVLKALEQRIWKIGIDANGPPVIEGKITIKFSDGTTVVIQISGSRITIWSFSADWSSSVVERLEWLTSITNSPLGDEQRRSLRLSPRRSFEVQALARDRERQLMDMAVFDWGGRNWALPIYPDVQELAVGIGAASLEIPCITANRDFRSGGLVILRGATAFDYEVAVIATVEPNRVTLQRPLQSAWARKSKVFPARSARFSEQPTFTRITDRAYSVKAKFQLSENSDWPAVSPSLIYRGKPVFELPPEESEELTSTYVRLLRMIDNSTDLPAYRDTANLGFTATAHRWLMHGAEEHSAMRSFYYSLRGRWKSVWLPTHADDVTMYRQALTQDTTLDVLPGGYARFGISRPGRRDLYILLTDNSVILRRVESATELTENGETFERLTLDGQIGQDLPVTKVKRISFMALCRLDQDFIEINHETDIEGLGSCKTTWRSLRDDMEV
ncbi:tail assembly protein [Pseudomonas phage SM1]|uniref:Virion structural protein n=1 Tax=Pseudomonas phage SM1 TaxID=1772332 RepID=A0A0U3CK89_9CAUD|nr:tail assembly protein [Pseudomonas phage SM1]ALT58006.1 hypothetical protein SM1_013 [Pseudomonas phage SM1]